MALCRPGLPGLSARSDGGESQQGALALFPTGSGQRATSCQPGSSRRRKVSHRTSERSPSQGNFVAPS